MTNGKSPKAKTRATTKMRDGTALKALTTQSGRYKKDNWM